MLKFKENPNSIACHSGCFLLCSIYCFINFHHFISYYIFVRLVYFLLLKYITCASLIIFLLSVPMIWHIITQNIIIWLSLPWVSFMVHASISLAVVIVNIQQITNLTRNCFIARTLFQGTCIFTSVYLPFSL